MVEDNLSCLVFYGDDTPGKPPLLECGSGPGLARGGKGVQLCARKTFQGGDPAYNAELLRGLLNSYTDSPATDMLCLNAGAALLANEQADSLQDGIKLARAILRDGKAKHKLADVIACSRALTR